MTEFEALVADLESHRQAIGRLQENQTLEHADLTAIVKRLNELSERVAELYHFNVDMAKVIFKRLGVAETQLPKPTVN